MRSWKKIGILAAVAALVVAVLALQPATAGDFRERVTGNFIDTSLDLAGGDGMAANYVSGATVGRNSASYEGLWEVQFTAPTGACPTGNVQGDVVAYSITRRYGNGDIQTSELIDGTLCFDTNTGAASLDIDAQITGGTGQFANASGHYNARYTVELLVPDPMGGIAHGIFYGDVRGRN